MKKSVKISVISLVVIIVLLIVILLFYVSKEKVCDKDCEYKKLDKIFSNLGKQNEVYGKKYLPAYLTKVDSDTFIGISYYPGSVNFYASSPYYMKLSTKEVGEIKSSQYESNFNNLGYRDISIECSKESEEVVNCNDFSFDIQPTEFEIPWPEWLNLTSLGYIETNSNFYRVDFKDNPLYFNEDKTLFYYYDNEVYFSMGNRPAVMTVVLRGNYNISQDSCHANQTYNYYGCFHKDDYTIIRDTSLNANLASNFDLPLPDYVKLFSN